MAGGSSRLNLHDIDGGGGDVMDYEQALTHEHVLKKNLDSELLKANEQLATLKSELDFAKARTADVQELLQEEQRRNGELHLLMVKVTASNDDLDTGIKREKEGLKCKKKELRRLREESKIVERELREEIDRTQLPTKIFEIVGPDLAMPSLSREGKVVYGNCLLSNAMHHEEAKQLAAALETRKDVGITSAKSVMAGEQRAVVHVFVAAIEDTFTLVKDGVTCFGANIKLLRPPTVPPFSLNPDAGLVVKTCFPSLFSTDMHRGVMGLFVHRSSKFDEKSRSSLTVFDTHELMEYYCNALNNTDFSGWPVECTQML